MFFFQLDSQGTVELENRAGESMNLNEVRVTVKAVPSQMSCNNITLSFCVSPGTVSREGKTTEGIPHKKDK